MADNRGAKALRELKLPQAKVAKAVGAHQSQVSRWERADRTPETKYRVKFDDIYGIGWGLWDELIEEEQANGSTG